MRRELANAAEILALCIYHSGRIEREKNVDSEQLEAWLTAVGRVSSENYRSSAGALA